MKAGHFSAKIPGQFSAEINNDDLVGVSRNPSAANSLLNRASSKSLFILAWMSMRCCCDVMAAKPALKNPPNVFEGLASSASLVRKLGVAASVARSLSAEKAVHASESGTAFSQIRRFDFCVIYPTIVALEKITIHMRISVNYKRKMSPRNSAARSKFLPSDEDDWQIRSDEWLQKYRKLTPFRPTKSRADWPLILTGHGVSLRVERDTLLIKNGFTHYPQQQEVLRFFPGSLTLPSRIIFLECSGSISFEVLAWLQRQKVELLHLNWQGDVFATTTSAGYSGLPEKMEWQWALRNNPLARMVFCNSLIERKIGNSLSNLEFMNFEGWDWSNACDFLKNALLKLKSNPPRMIEELLGLEGNCAAMYFRAWRSVTLAWKGSSRRFIPANWGGYDQRSSMDTATGNAKATHPINAILNYAYRVKESELLVRCLAEGFDPRLGILHELKDGRNSFLCDLIELERASVDLRVFQFLRSTAFEASDFNMGANGVVRLNPQMARYIAGLISKDAPRGVSEQLDGLTEGSF